MRINIVQIMKKSGFKVEEDGTISVRYGTQSNCAGIAQIQVQIEHSPNSGIQFLSLSDSEFHYTDFLTGEDTPAYFQSAIFEGAAEAYTKFVSPEGVKFTLLNALVHPVDSNEMVFKLAGEIAVIGWYQLHSNSGDISSTNLYRLMSQLHEYD
jgi:hypothetical protein